MVTINPLQRRPYTNINAELWQNRFGSSPWEYQFTPTYNPVERQPMGRLPDQRAPLASLYPASAGPAGMAQASRQVYPAGVFVTPNEPQGGVVTPGQSGGGVTTREPIPQVNPYQAALARSLMATGASTAPVASPVEGIARALTGAVGGYFAGQANEAEQARQAALGERMAQLYGVDPAAVEGLGAADVAAYAESEAKKQADAAAAAADRLEKGFTQEKDLRKEFSGLSKNFREQRAGYNRVLAAAENPSPAGDLALIFSFMKVLDPTSVVRESEFATAENAGNIPQRVRAVYNRLLTGQGRLSAEQRADFVNRAGALYSGALDTHRGLEEEYAGLAGAYGLDRARTVPDYVRGLEPQTIEVEETEEVSTAGNGVEAGVATETTVAEPASEGPYGAVYTDKQGNDYNWNPATGKYELVE